MIACRPQTQDGHVFTEIFERNEYRLPMRFEPGSLVIDIGAHVGMFSTACLKRGAEVIAFEPDLENFLVMEENIAKEFRLTANTPPFRAYNMAVWKPGYKYVSFSGYPMGYSACGTIVPNLTVGRQNKRQPVKAISLDEIVAMAKRPIRLMKMDAEAAEYGILYSSKLESLARIEEVAMEVHEPWTSKDGKTQAPGMEDFTGQGLKRFFTDAGFEVEIEGTGEFGVTQLLFAKRI